MRAKYRISASESAKIRERMRVEKKKFVYRRLLVCALLSEGKRPDEIAETTGFCERSVRDIGILYNTEGIDRVAKDMRKGGNRRNLTSEQEDAFLAPYEEQFKSGRMLSAKTLAEAYDKATGREHKSPSSMYYLLHKKGLRTIMPRGQHPNKADDEAIIASKKLSKL